MLSSFRCSSWLIATVALRPIGQAFSAWPRAHAAADVVFVESSEHAYSQIKRVQPNLVILCVRIDDANGFQVLSMLKLDDDTRAIPVLTYTSEGGDEDLDDAYAEPSDGELFPASKAAVWMN